MSERVAVEFLFSGFDPSQFPAQSLPEIAFAGRSNVGKSSLLNTLLGEKNLARVSATPGRTQSINFFLVDERFLCVDLPGYGFARVASAMRQDWKQLIESYLARRQSLAAVILLVDGRHPAQESDLAMADFLEQAELPWLLVATKTDKLSPGQWERAHRQLAEGFGVELTDVLPFSAVTGEGAAPLWSLLLETVAEREARLKQEGRWGLPSRSAPAPKKAAPPSRARQERVSAPRARPEGKDPGPKPPQPPAAQKNLPAWLRYAPQARVEKAGTAPPRKGRRGGR